MGTRPSADDHAELLALEEAMWRDETRWDRAWMQAHLTGDFVEFGASGRVYDRAAILAQVETPIGAVLPLAEYSLEALTDDIALATYVSDTDGRRANRASLWVRSDSGWRLRFHQGTLVGP